MQQTVLEGIIKKDSTNKKNSLQNFYQTQLKHWPKNWKSEPSAYHHSIKKHICHHFNWTKTNIKKFLKKISEDFLVVGENAANCTWRLYKERFNKKTLYKPSIKLSSTIDPKIENQCPVLIIIASKSTFVITFIKIISKKSLEEPSKFSSSIFVMSKHVHLIAL